MVNGYFQTMPDQNILLGNCQSLWRVQVLSIAIIKCKVMGYRQRSTPSDKKYTTIKNHGLFHIQTNQIKTGDLLLWVVRRPLTSSSHELLDQSLPNLVCSISRVRKQETRNCKFHDPTPQREIILGIIGKIL